MKDRDLTRRSFVGRSLAAAALPLVPAHAGSDAARLTVVCVGGIRTIQSRGVAGRWRGTRRSGTP